MTISVGDKIPSATLKVMGAEGPKDMTTDELFAGKKVVLFGVPGAFTPGCSKAHLPGFVVKADDILAKGVDTIACVAVNDAFVMDAWGKEHNAEKITMLGDGNGELANKMGLEMDGSGFGLGTRNKRFALIADDGKVSWLAVDESGAVEKSKAEEVLANL